MIVVQRTRNHKRSVEAGTLPRPLQGVDQPFHILLQELVHGTKGIFIGCCIEIKGTSEKMLHRIGNEKLVGGGGIAFQGKINAIVSIWGCKRYGVNTGSFGRMLLVGKIESIIHK